MEGVDAILKAFFSPLHRGKRRGKDNHAEAIERGNESVGHNDDINFAACGPVQSGFGMRERRPWKQEPGRSNRKESWWNNGSCPRSCIRSDHDLCNDVDDSGCGRRGRRRVLWRALGRALRQGTPKAAPAASKNWGLSGAIRKDDGSVVRLVGLRTVAEVDSNGIPSRHTVTPACVSLAVASTAFAGIVGVSDRDSSLEIDCLRDPNDNELRSLMTKRERVDAERNEDVAMGMASADACNTRREVVGAGRNESVMSTGFGGGKRRAVAMGTAGGKLLAGLGSSSERSETWRAEGSTRLLRWTAAQRDASLEQPDQVTYLSDRSVGTLTLPVWERNGGRLRQYVWDGRKLRTVEVDTSLDTGEEWEESMGDRPGMWGGMCDAMVSSFRKRLRRAGRGLQGIFTPEEVTPDYWEYMRWRIIQRTVCAFNHVNATQSLLRAVGVGGARSLPTAAAVNWVLKDGLGRLGKLAYAARFGRTFDSELKRVRFTTSVLFTLSLGMEMATPFFPKLFLPIATLANVGKSIGLAAYVATTPSMNKSFALNENMADVAAKGQAQTVMADNVGLALAVGLNAALRHNDPTRMMMPLALYPLLATMDIYAIWRELKSVHLRTLNRDRVEIIVEEWLKSGKVLCANRVSERERLFCPSQMQTGDLPLTIGGLGKAVSSTSDLWALLSDQLSDRRYHLIVTHGGPVSTISAALNPIMWICNAGKKPVCAPGKQLVLSFRDDADAPDIIKGILQAGCLRSLLCSNALDGTCAHSPPPSPPPPPPPLGEYFPALNSRSSLHAVGARHDDVLQEPRRFAKNGCSAGEGLGDGVHQSLSGISERLATIGKWRARGKQELSVLIKGSGGGERWSEERRGVLPDRGLLDWAMDESRKMAESELGPLISAMVEQGWQTKRLTLASGERATFSLVRGGLGKRK